MVQFRISKNVGKKRKKTRENKTSHAQKKKSGMTISINYFNITGNRVVSRKEKHISMIDT